MGLHDIALRLGLTYASEKDGEHLLAKYISEKFQEAAKIFIQINFVDENKNTKTIKFLDCLHKVWNPISMKGTNKYKFLIDNPYLNKTFPDLCGEKGEIRISINKAISGESYGETYHYEGAYAGMYLAVGALDNSENLELFKKNFMHMITTIYHECDHIYLSAQENSSEGFEKVILYYIDEAEIRAHSKEFAFLFHTIFPGQKYNHELLKRYIQNNYKPEEKTYQLFLRYLELMRDPKNWESANQEYMNYVKNRILVPGHRISVKDLKKTFIKYMNYITNYVNYYNSNPEHKIDLLKK